MSQPTKGDPTGKRSHDLSIILCDHYPTTGMSVTMGVTCRCGFWEGRSLRRREGWDGLEVHRAEVAHEFFTEDFLTDPRTFYGDDDE